MLQDVQYFRQRLGNLEGASDVATHIISIVQAKAPPPTPTTPAIPTPEVPATPVEEETSEVEGVEPAQEQGQGEGESAVDAASDRKVEAQTDEIAASPITRTQSSPKANGVTES